MQNSKIETDYLEILTPPSVISTSQSELYIIGRTNAPIVEVYINDIKYQDCLVKDSVFHALLNYGYGVNEIKVKPVFSGTNQSEHLSESLEILYSPEYDRKMMKLYSPYAFHSTDLKSACLKCHKVNFSSFDEINDADVCTDCHVSLKERVSKHTNAEERTCINCHQLGDQLAGALFDSGSTQNPCLKCHNDKIKDFGQEYIHGPVAGGSCTICHDPHGSTYEKSLKNPEQILCVSCHEDIENEFRKPVVHKPFEQGYCGECHDPHSTSNKWVLVKSTEEVCMNCHNTEKDLKWHSHPYNVKPKKKLKTKLELNKRGHLECISCHNPHSTNSPHLLRVTNEFACIGCHSGY